MINRILRSLQTAVSPQLRHAIAWSLYSRLVRFVSARRKSYPRQTRFAEIGFEQGVLPETDVKRMLDVIHNSPAKAIAEEDSLPDYDAGPGLKQYEGVLNSGREYIFLSPEHVAALASSLEPLTDAVETSIKSPWRVVNIRCWKTLPWITSLGPSAWHTDGMPSDLRKIMVYLSPVSNERGTTELKLRDGSTTSLSGPPGLWMLFENSELLHREVAPVTGERILLEVTIAPSFENHRQPRCGGMNARYPKYPWIKSLRAWQS